MFRYENREEKLISKADFLRLLGHSFLVGLLFGPVSHRILHSFHYGADREDENL
jgi:hypothetical protein